LTAEMPVRYAYFSRVAMRTSASHPFRSASAKAEYLALYEERASKWPVACETRLIDTPSGQTYVRISGRPSDPPLVLLHGVRGNSLMWIPNIAALSAHYRTYALDTIDDTGLSVRQRPITKPEHLIAWLDEVLAVLSPAEPVHLVGMSFGGWLASQYALRFPARLQKLVMLAPAATVLPVSLAFILHALPSLLPGIKFRKRFYYWLLHDTVQSGADGRVAVDQAAADWALAERCFKRLGAIPATVLPDEAWRALKVPSLYLVGENEKIYPAHKALERLKRVAPQITAKLIPRAGHDLWMAQAELVTTTILDFLNDAALPNPVNE
jgi:pimeloyl-ACP methyl ester carboxylesterase